MEKDFIPLPEAAKNAGITVDKARHWATQLGISITKFGRVRQISAEGAIQLATMANMVTGGKSPQEASAIILATPCVAPVKSEPPNTFDLSPVITGQSEIQRAVLAIAESFRNEVAGVRVEMSRMADENRRLADEVLSLRKCLEYKIPETKNDTAVSVTLVNTRKENTLAPIRAVVLESSQREITFFESVKLGIDDCFGLLFGRG